MGKETMRADMRRMRPAEKTWQHQQDVAGMSSMLDGVPSDPQRKVGNLIVKTSDSYLVSLFQKVENQDPYEKRLEIQE